MVDSRWRTTAVFAMLLVASVHGAYLRVSMPPLEPETKPLDVRRLPVQAHREYIRKNFMRQQAMRFASGGTLQARSGEEFPSLKTMAKAGAGALAGAAAVTAASGGKPSMGALAGGALAGAAAATGGGGLLAQGAGLLAAGPGLLAQGKGLLNAAKGLGALFGGTVSKMKPPAPRPSRVRKPKKCPGTPPCSGHGSCNSKTGKCQCFPNWSGKDCSEDPLASAVANSPCGNMSKPLTIACNKETGKGGTCEAYSLVAPWICNSTCLLIQGQGCGVESRKAYCNDKAMCTGLCYAMMEAVCEPWLVVPPAAEGEEGEGKSEGGEDGDGEDEVDGEDEGGGDEEGGEER